MANIVQTIGILVLFIGCASVRAQVDAAMCGPIKSGFGPFDYRPERDPPTAGTGDHTTKLRLVESAHFQPVVEMLISAAKSKALPGGDIDYTLRAFPNHHRALLTVIRYGEKYKSDKPYGLTFTVECYLERAARFANDDPLVRMIYSSFLYKKNRQPEAIAHLEYATKLAADNGFTHYNIGLFYTEMKIYDKALASAHRAIELGFDRTELPELIKAAGKWQEPATERKP